MELPVQLPDRAGRGVLHLPVPGALRRQGHCPGRVLEAGIVRGRARPTAAAGTAGTATGAIAGTTVAAVCRRTVRLRQCEAQRRRPAGGAGHPGAGA
ncbi:hypothetical protein G6F61_014640 [Rhizopus arrhizus]|nr:hypothetical protein G6F61_014640 [Rhizopus arrhizus]